MINFSKTDEGIGKIYANLVKGVCDYVTENKLECMILGVSGGIDSTLVAAICHDVKCETGVRLVGVSLMCSTNKKDESDIADLVGTAFCDEYYKYNIQSLYEETSKFFAERTAERSNAIAEGNIKARIRMMYLWHLGGLRKGVVMDTDNLTEHLLGFWTLQGDSNYLTPIGNLWKTEVYRMAEWVKDKLTGKAKQALEESIAIKPTDGLGITDTDLDQIGAKSYRDVDVILYSNLFKGKDTSRNVELDKQYTPEVVDKVMNRYWTSEFKRKHIPLSINLDDGTILEERDFLGGSWKNFVQRGSLLVDDEKDKN